MYHQIGGYNRQMRIADDYELLVRTFLNTSMVHITYTCYVQFMNGKNTQDINRPEISRKVDYIRRFYNEQIVSRFNQLGIEDWCNSEYKFITERSRFGEEEEGIANLIFN